MVPLSRKQSNSSVELSLELYSVLKKEYCNYYNIILKSNLLFKIDKPSSHLSHRSVTKLASPIHTLWEYKQYVKFKREWKHSRVTLSLTVQLSIKGIPIISINSRNYGLFEFLRKTHLFLLREVYPTACGTLKISFEFSQNLIYFILFKELKYCYDHKIKEIVIRMRRINCFVWSQSKSRHVDVTY